jgi:hypothetical protein
MAVAGTACVPETWRNVEDVGTQAASVEPRRDDSAHVVVAYDNPGEAAPEAEVPVRRSSILLPDPVFFRLGAGYGALGHIDLAPCREQGLPPGYLRMRVTFRHDGHVVRASVYSTTEPPRDALACVGQRLDLAMVPVFDGEDVTLSKSVFVN